MERAPVPDRASDVLSALRERYADARPRSTAAHRRSLKVLPGGNSRTPLHFDPFPAYLVHGAGAVVRDLDGHEYFDMVNNYTSLVHGHSDPNSWFRTLSDTYATTALGAPTVSEIELAELLCERFPSIESIRFANSGTEATLYAVRTARLRTGRNVIVKLEGGYHGGGDSLQVSVKHLGDQPGDAQVEPGTPPGVSMDTRIVTIEDLGDTGRMVRLLEGAAGLIIEPVQGGAGALPVPPELLHNARLATERAGALLIFDEVMTGRLGYGGMQEILGIKPDLTALGKFIGGGLPIGAFGGSREIMSPWDPTGKAGTYHAGTYNANPAAMLAGLRTLTELTAARIEQLNSAGDALREQLEGKFAAYGLPASTTGYGSVFQIHSGATPPHDFRDAVQRDKTLVLCLHLALLEHGVMIAPRGTVNVSTALERQLDEVTQRIGDAVSHVSRLLRAAPDATENHPFQAAPQ